MAKGSVVGLNIGSSTIKVAELQKGRGGIEVTAIGITPTPEDTVSNGVIIAPDVLGETIKDLLASSGIRSKSTVSSVAGQSSLVVQIIEVPKMSDAELKETMSYEVERHIPFAATEVIMDFKPLHPADEDPDAQNMEVLLCVAQEDMINAHVETLEAAGLRPEAIDIEALSAARVSIDLVGEATPGETVGILNIGASVTDITVVRDGLLNFTRAVPVAGDTLTQAIVDSFGIEKFEAERIKKELGAAILEGQQPAEDVDFSGGATGAEVADLDGFTEPDFDFGAVPASGDESETAPVSDSDTLLGGNTDTFGETAADNESATSPQPEVNPFDLSLDDVPSAPAVPDNPFDLSLDDASRSVSAPSPASDPPANPFDLSLDADSPVQEPAGNLSLAFSETETVLEEDVATPPPGAFDLGGGDTARANADEPLFDFGSTGESPAEAGAVSSTASPGMNPFLHGGGVNGAETATGDVTTEFGSPGVNPFLDEGTGDDNMFGGENLFADAMTTSIAPQEEITPGAVYRVLSPVLEELVTETRRSLEYYTSRYPDAVIGRLVIMGGTARLKHLDKFLSNELGIRVVTANPFEHLTLNSKDTPPEYAEELAPSLAVSIGLALRDMV